MSETNFYYPSNQAFTQFASAKNDIAALQAIIEDLRKAARERQIAFPKQLSKASPALATLLQNPEKDGFVILENAEFGKRREETLLAAKERRIQQDRRASLSLPAETAGRNEMTDDTPAHIGKSAGKKTDRLHTVYRREEGGRHGRPHMEERRKSNRKAIFDCN